MSREIPLTRGYVAIVDDEDYERVAEFKWYAAVRKGTCSYAARHRRDSEDAAVPEIVYLHRFIIQPMHGLCVDHIDGNGLNCVRANMRLCTQKQNSYNTAAKDGIPNKSVPGIKGVYFSRERRKWFSQITFNGKVRHLGSFVSLNDAARAYNAKASELYGEFARLNPTPGEPNA